MSLLRKLRRLCMRFLAYMHWSQKAVCEMSEGMGLNDYHMFEDSDDEVLPSVDWTLHCRYCNKEFQP